ncbi:MAG TPA: DUF554 domain-containing protein [Nitrospirota bacterium]|nr:DUF554 domain-containing protein [Nitrospirota bacterium]
MKGYLFNSLLVVAGSVLGLLVGKKIHDDVKENVFIVLGLVTAFVGIKMSLQGRDIIPMVFSLVLGTFLGSILKLEDRLHGYLNRLNDSYLPGTYDIEGFLVASTLFCVGSMTIIGSLKDGLYNDGTLIRTKSVMDGFASFILASRYGPSVALSAITILFVQGILTTFSGALTFLATEQMMHDIDGVGGIIVFAIGFNLLKLKTIKTIDMLPGLVLIVVYRLWRG